MEKTAILVRGDLPGPRAEGTSLPNSSCQQNTPSLDNTGYSQSGKQKIHMQTDVGTSCLGGPHTWELTPSLFRYEFTENGVFADCTNQQQRCAGVALKLNEFWR